MDGKIMEKFGFIVNLMNASIVQVPKMFQKQCKKNWLPLLLFLFMKYVNFMKL